MFSMISWIISTEIEYRHVATIYLLLFSIIPTRTKRRDEYALLIIDGCSSHLSTECMTAAFLRELRDHKILVLVLPANTTHVLQASDAHFNGIFKHYLMEERKEWVKANQGAHLTIEVMLRDLLPKAYKRVDRNSILRSWSETGLQCAGRSEAPILKEVRDMIYY